MNVSKGLDKPFSISFSTFGRRPCFIKGYATCQLYPSRPKRNSSGLSSSTILSQDEYKIIIVITVFICSIFGGLGQIYLKKGMTDFILNEILKNYNLMFGVLIYIIAFVTYNITLRYEKVSLLYPIIACSYCWVMIFSHYMLNESITIFKIMGSILIIIGVAVIYI